jgi:predicted SAM-dependent methyltransferase
MRGVNLGSGRERYGHDDFLTVDKLALPGIDFVWDLENGLPKINGASAFPENSVDMFFARHVLEHIKNLIPLMDEMWVALIPGGKLHVYVPNAHHVIAAWSDPTHVRAFVPETFSYFTREKLCVYPYTKREWMIHDGYPRVNGTPPDDLWEIECVMSPVK